MNNLKFMGAVCLTALCSASCEQPSLTDWLQHHHGSGHGWGHHDGDDAPCDGGVDAGALDDGGTADTGAPPDAADGATGCGADDFAGTAGVGATCIRKATSVSVGANYACAVLTGGDLKCWGRDDPGVLGYGAPYTTRGDQANELGTNLPVVALGTGLSAKRVVASQDLTCALLNDDNVKCWGYDGYHVTGYSPTGQGLPPDQLAEHSFGAHHATAVSAGSGFAVAILEDGSLSWWGFGGVPLGAGRVAVSFDRQPTYDAWQLCAVLDDGHIVCNSPSEVVRTSGALGYVPPTTSVATPSFVDLGTGRTATQVATGLLFTCALLDDQTVKCWGTNSDGQLGQGDTMARGLDASTMGDALAPIPLGQPAIAITVGFSHACAILADHSVKCWGANDGGQLGIGSTAAVGDQPGEVAALAAVDLGAGRTAVAIDAGTHTCVVLDNGAVKCWGRNSYGELGQGDTITRGDAPGQMGDMLPVIDLGP